MTKRSYKEEVEDAWNGNSPLVRFFKKMEATELALTFDDVTTRSNKSDVLPEECDVKTYFTRNVPLNIPIASAAMDTVT